MWLDGNAQTNTNADICLILSYFTELQIATVLTHILRAS